MALKGRLVLAVVLLGPPACAPAPRGAATTIDRSRVARRRADYAGALPLAKRAISSSGAGADAYEELALVLEGLGRRDDAIAATRAGLAAWPDSGALRLRLAGQLRAAGRFDEAAGQYAQARERDPGLLSAYIEEGYARLAAGETAEGLAALSAGVAASSGSPVALHHLAAGHWDAGELEKAFVEMQAARRGLEDDPRSSPQDHAHTLHWLSNMHEALGKPGSDELLRLAMSRSPDFRPHGHAVLAWRLAERAAFREAAIEAEEGLALCETRACAPLSAALLLAVLAQSRAVAGDAPAARDTAARALVLAFTSAPTEDNPLKSGAIRLGIARRCAMVYERLGDSAAAVAALERGRAWSEAR